MRILYVSGSGSLGGAERVLLDLLQGMRRRGHDVGLLSAEPGPLVERAREIATAEVLPFPARFAVLGESGRRAARVLLDLPRIAGPVARYVQRVRALARDWSPDVVHSNGTKAHIVTAWARPGAPLVWHLHEYVGVRGVSARLLRLSAARCAGAVAVSTSVADDFRRAVPGTRVSVVPNAVDLARFTADGTTVDLDALAGLPPAASGVVRVGLVATYAWWKGHDVFLEALARLPADLPVRGYVIGGAVYRTGTASQVGAGVLTDRIAALGLGGRVGLTGFVADAAAAMRSLDVVVHASTAPEPFGLVIAEAMACGRAIVVSAAGGAAEIVRSGVDALTYRPGDAAGLAAHVTALARDPERRRGLADASRRAAATRFDLERLVTGIEGVYHEVTGRSRCVR